MSFFDESLLEMLDVYIYESNELFEQLDCILLKHQQDKTLDEDDIHAIFRIMHTTKSSSAMMELQQISVCMHRMEDIFSILREHPASIQGHEQEIFALLYDVSDFMHQQLDKMREDNYQPQDMSMFHTRIEKLLAEMTNKPITSKIAESAPLFTPQTPSTPQISNIPQTREPLKETDAYVYLHLQYEEGCMMENVRAYMVVLQLKPLCEKLISYPSELENNSEAATYIQKQGFYIAFLANDVSQVIKVAQNALFVKTCEQVEEAATPFAKKDKKASIKNEDKKDAFLSVRTEKLDALQNVIGEMLIARETFKNEMRQQGLSKLTDFYGRTFDKLYTHLEELVMLIRLVPFSVLVPKLSRVIREIASKEDKNVVFEVEGEAIELDKEIVDHLFEPLMHLLRNAVDHGLETRDERRMKKKSEQCKIVLKVEQSNSEIQIQVIDDGRGLDAQRIKEKAIENQLLQKNEHVDDEQLYQYLLMPGFSTKKEVSEFSGRGVGLDVVKQMIQKCNGLLTIASEVDKGTVFTLNLPATLSIMEALIFVCHDIVYAIAVHAVERFCPWQDIFQSDDEHIYYRYEGKSIPVLFLDEQYERIPAKRCQEYVDKILICLRTREQRIVLAVDEVVETRNIVDKPLPDLMQDAFQQYTGIFGYSLLGDGHICYDLHAETLIRNALKGRDEDAVRRV